MRCTYGGNIVLELGRVDLFASDYEIPRDETGSLKTSRILSLKKVGCVWQPGMTIPLLAGARAQGRRYRKDGDDDNHGGKKGPQLKSRDPFSSEQPQQRRMSGKQQPCPPGSSTRSSMIVAGSSGDLVVPLLGESHSSVVLNNNLEQGDDAVDVLDQDFDHVHLESMSEDEIEEMAHMAEEAAAATPEVNAEPAHEFTPWNLYWARR